jgi:arylsulfatase A-like enzyme
MSLYGYRRPTTPNLERLARQAVVFTDARSQAACTFPSVNSLLTSRQPASFLEQPGGIYSIPPTMPSLPEILARHGYATAAVSASSIVRSTPSRINVAGGFGRGFQTFDESCEAKRAPCVNGRALSLVKDLRRPWFLYLHYMEPHAPYLPPPKHVRRIAATNTAAREKGVHGWALRGNPGRLGNLIYHGEAGLKVTRQDLAHLSDLYDEEIVYLDEQLARLFAMLRKRKLLAKTLIVLAADHGEELYEHRHIGHCRDIAFETVLKTPLVLWIPGVEPGRRGALVENLDLVPTVLDYLGLSTAGLGLEGASLRPVIESDKSIHRLSFGLQGVTRTVRDGTHKLMLDLSSRRAQLFDVEADPGERINVLSQQRAAARSLQAALVRWMEIHEGASTAGEALRRAEELEKRLRAVGYL